MQFTRAFRSAVFLLFLSFITLSLRSQCEVKKDAFSGESRTVGSFFSYAFLPFNGYLIEHSTKSTKLTLCFAYSGVVEKKWPAGAEVKLKLASGDVLTLLSQAESIPVSGNSSNIIYTRYVVDFDINAAVLQQLSGAALTDVRYPNLVQGGSVDVEIGKSKLYRKIASKLQKSATCVLKGGA